MAVYFARAGDEGPIKIGKSKDPFWRLSQLQKGMPYELTLMAIIPGGTTEERELHRRFHDLWIRGEWFRADPSLCEFVIGLGWSDPRTWRCDRTVAETTEEKKVGRFILRVAILERENAELREQTTLLRQELKAIYTRAKVLLDRQKARYEFALDFLHDRLDRARQGKARRGEVP